MTTDAVVASDGNLTPTDLMRRRIVNRAINPLLDHLPPKFSSFRPQQIAAIDQALRYFDSGERFVFLDAPTGTGKTVMGEAIGSMMGLRRLYMCTTKSLQDQFLADFPYARLLKGRSNYPTQLFPRRWHPERDYDSHLSCEDCTWKPSSPSCKWCREKRQCPYEVAKRAALRDNLAVLNTAYFMAEANSMGRFAIGDAGAEWNRLIVVDEADTLESQLMNHISVEISERRRERYGLPLVEHGSSKASWESWLVNAIPVLQARYDLIPEIPTDVREAREASYLDRLIEKLTFVLAGLDDGYWVYDGAGEGDKKERVKNIVFRPSRVSSLGADYFWRHGYRFLCMSATPISCDEIAQSTGLPGRFAVVKLDSPFPVQNRQVKYKPVADMAARNKEQSWPKVAQAVRELADRHPDDRVLVHTVSYALTRYLDEQMGGMQGHNGRPVISYTNAQGRQTALVRFNQQAKSICLAPSMDRGIDLPGDLCRVQIIVKCPFPFLDRVTNARVHGPGGDVWYRIQTIRALIQMCGRAVRSETDWAVTYILDTQFEGNVYSKGRGLFPPWFAQAIDWRSER